MQFTANPIRFGAPQAEPPDVLTPHRLKVERRRMLAIGSVKESLGALPEAGESVHMLVSKRLDLIDVLTLLLETLGACERFTLSTLGYNAKALAQLLKWLDNGLVHELNLLASKWWVSNNKELWENTVNDFRQRGQRAAIADTHCKVFVMRFASGKVIVLEGSANLTGSGSFIEQVFLVSDSDLAAWHEAWIIAKIG